MSIPRLLLPFAPMIKWRDIFGLFQRRIDYVTMKAKEMGLPAPKLNGQRQAFAPTKSATGGAAGGNSTSFNAFKELKAIAAGQKQYVCGPATKSNGKAAAPAVEETREFDYEGNQLQVDKSGALKDPSQLKTFPENLVLGFELKGDAPANHSEARLNYKEVKVSILIVTRHVMWDALSHSVFDCSFCSFLMVIRPA